MVSGTRVEITVIAVNAVGIVEYQWYRFRPGKKYELIPGVATDTLVFDPVLREDHGFYVCVATANNGEAQSPVVALVVDTGLELVNTFMLAVLLTAMFIASWLFLIKAKGNTYG